MFLCDRLLKDYRRSIKLSRYIGNSIGIVLLYSLGGSTVQWGAGRGFMCLAGLVEDHTFVHDQPSYPSRHQTT